MSVGLNVILAGFALLVLPSISYVGCTGNRDPSGVVGRVDAPTATPVPKPSPTTIARESEAVTGPSFEDFVSISYEASLEMPGELTEGGYPVTASVEGWMTVGVDDGGAQFFARIDMIRPVERSIEVVSRSATFSMYLHDLDADEWYFIPENSSAVDSGPLRDILNLGSFGMLYSAWPRDQMQQAPDGYVWEFDDPTLGSVTVTFDQAYALQTFALADPDGNEVIRARYFDLNEMHDLVPYEDVEELLPEDYWKSP